MKLAAVNDNFRRMREKVNYKDIKAMKFTDIPSIGGGEITFNDSRINAICGCNGSGKTTIMQALAYSFNNELGLDVQKINKGNIQITVRKASEEKNLTELIDEFSLVYHDIYKYSYAKEMMAKYFNYYEADDEELQANIKRLIDELEPRELTKEELEDISKVVCRKYDSARYYLVEIEEGNQIPFFLVNYRGVEYTSITMGLGEHSVFYIFYIIDQVENNAIVLIEEPENFLSPKSQRYLIELLVKYSLDRKYGGKGIKIVISTHSPYILKELRCEEIRLLLRDTPNKVAIISPKSHSGYAKTLGMDINPCKIILVEDIAAKIFTVAWLKDMDYYFLDDIEISIADGDEGIKLALKFPKIESFRILGLFDGDIRNYDKEKVSERHKIVKEDDIRSFKHGHAFLPLENVEEAFRDCFEKYKDYFCKEFSMGEEHYLVVRNYLDGLDKHDWLEELSREVKKSKESIIEIFYKKWITEHVNTERSDTCFNILKDYFDED